MWDNINVMAFNLKNFEMYDEVLRELLSHNHKEITYSLFQKVNVNWSDSKKIIDEIMEHDSKLVDITHPHSSLRSTEFTRTFLKDGGFKKLYFKSKRNKIGEWLLKLFSVIIYYKSQ